MLGLDVRYRPFKVFMRYGLGSKVGAPQPWRNSESEAERLFYISASDFDIETWKRPPHGDLEEAAAAHSSLDLKRDFPKLTTIRLR